MLSPTAKGNRLFCQGLWQGKDAIMVGVVWSWGWRRPVRRERGSVWRRGWSEEETWAAMNKEDQGMLRCLQPVLNTAVET